MPLLALLVTSLFAQESRTILRQEKNDYNAVVTKCRDGEALIDSDPQQAIERLTEVLAAPRIRFWECSLRIEQRPGEVTDPYNFFPYQYRGRARVVLAKRAGPEVAQKLLAGAIEDFQESVKRGLASSAELLKGAQASLAKIKADLTKPSDPIKVDPIIRFREIWDPLISQNRFKSARASIEKDGEGLSEDSKKAFLQSTEGACRDYLVRWVSAFRPSFISAMLIGLDQKTPEEFDLLFGVPPMEELVVSSPAIDWVRQYLPVFRDVQSQKAPAYALADAAVASAPLEERLENPWFKAVENTVFLSLKGAISDEISRAQDAPRAEREKARAQADSLLGRWKSFLGKLEPKFVQKHRFLADHESQLSKLFDGFPVDLSELDRLDPAVDVALGAESPDTELSKLEETLAGFESRSNLARESRQRLYTLRVTVGALRGLFSGKAEEAVAADLSAFRQKLKDAGGPEGDVKKYGPRVERVFAELR